MKCGKHIATAMHECHLLLALVIVLLHAQGLIIDLQYAAYYTFYHLLYFIDCVNKLCCTSVRGDSVAHMDTFGTQHMAT